jgi:DNA-binding PadR family transcriptional regulator
MKTQGLLSELELLILLTILHLGDEAYGVPISRELARQRGHAVSLAGVYSTLDRLELAGLVASSLGEATPERGGRAKRYFRLTRGGLRAVHNTRRVLTQLWSNIPALNKEPA